MDRYLASKRFRENCLCGCVNLRHGTTLTCDDGGLLHLEDGRPVCYDHSQQAYDYFSINNDGQGLARGSLVAEIRARLAKKDRRYQARWDKLWADAGANLLRSRAHQDHWIWGYAFYTAPVEELQRILRLIKEV